jgi:hypothetical protein
MFLKPSQFLEVRNFSRLHEQIFHFSFQSSSSEGEVFFVVFDYGSLMIRHEIVLMRKLFALLIPVQI